MPAEVVESGHSSHPGSADASCYEIKIDVVRRNNLDCFVSPANTLQSQYFSLSLRGVFWRIRQARQLRDASIERSQLHLRGSL